MSGATTDETGSDRRKIGDGWGPPDVQEGSTSVDGQCEYGCHVESYSYTE